MIRKKSKFLGHVIRKKKKKDKLKSLNQERMGKFKGKKEERKAKIKIYQCTKWHGNKELIGNNKDRAR